MLSVVLFAVARSFVGPLHIKNQDYIYIYIYIYTHTYISLSLYIYIYIYMYSPVVFR